MNNEMVMYNELEDEFEMTAEEFGFFLTSMRETLGISQANMAELLGYNKNSYNAYENGKRLPRDWKSVELILRDKVKEHLRKMRENDQLVEKIDFELGQKIIELHEKGKNIVQIGISLDIDEVMVSNFLYSKDYTPEQFYPGWD